MYGGNLELDTFLNYNLGNTQYFNYIGLADIDHNESDSLPGDDNSSTDVQVSTILLRQI